MPHESPLDAPWAHSSGKPSLWADTAGPRVIAALYAADRIDPWNGEDRLRKTRALYFEAFERLKETETVGVVDGSGPEDQVAERV